jgi:hypothetical protein
MNEQCQLIYLIPHLHLSAVAVVHYGYPMAQVAKAKSRSTRSPRSGKNEKGEYATFETALKKVLGVSHQEMQKRLTRASAARASTSKD